MSLESPILNTKVSAAVKAAWQLSCQQRGVKPGVRLREYVEREVLADRAVEAARSVGFEEVMRRLATPTYPTHVADSTGQPETAQGKLRTTLVSRYNGWACGVTR